MYFKIFSLIIPLLLLSGCSRSSSNAYSEGRLLVVGDMSASPSEATNPTQIFSVLLQQYADNKGFPANVINISSPKLSIAEFTEEVDGVLNYHQPQALLILLGYNDIFLPSLSPLIGDFEVTLNKMLDKITSVAPNTHIFLTIQSIPAAKGIQYSSRFTEMYSRAASGRDNVTLIENPYTNVFNKPQFSQGRILLPAGHREVSNLLFPLVFKDFAD